MNDYRLAKNIITAPTGGTVVEATGTPPMVRTPASNIVRLLNDALDLGRKEGDRPRPIDPAVLSDAVKTVAAQRDGWREIGEVLIRIAFGWEMSGFGAVPPKELLDAVRGADPKLADEPKPDPNRLDVAIAPPADDEVLGRLRDGLLGRAWRVRGPKGYGTCDYPLCDKRGKGVPLQNVILQIPDPAVPGQLIMRSPLRVCSGDDGKECQTWGGWVASRARAGKIQVSE
jgi:hypothetical protein